MSRRGFTLIELLTAMVLMAVLAAISLKIVNARAQAYLAVLESDIRNVAVAQEAYYALQATQPGGPKYAPSMEFLDFNPSPHVHVVMIGIETGWTARAQHELRTDFRCAVYMGDVKGIITIYEPAITEGVIECEPKSQKGGLGKGKK